MFLANNNWLQAPEKVAEKGEYRAVEMKDKDVA